MVSDEPSTSPAEFNAVDVSADPDDMIRFLDAANAVPDLKAAKQALMEQVVLRGARTALDVGCGPGQDIVEMARIMPDGAQLSGLDSSETMIAEARRRATSLGAQVALRVGDAADLPYNDQVFDICRASTVLEHVQDPERVVREMARVTRPGGRVGVLAFDQGTTFLDHPDLETTRIVLDTFAEAVVQGHIGRQLPRLFRVSGLTNVSVVPRVILSGMQFWQMLIHRHLAELQAQGLMSNKQASRWWTELDGRARAGDFIAGAVVFVVTGHRPV